MVGAAVRLVAAEGPETSGLVAERVRRLQAAARVILVSANRPYAAWQDDLQARGVDTSALLVVDAVAGMGSQAPVRLPNVLHVASPTLLELVGLRVEQQAVRRGGTHVVVDSLCALAHYNGVEQVEAFTHYLANRCRGLRVGADLLVGGSPVGRRVQARVQALVDEVVAAPPA